MSKCTPKSERFIQEIREAIERCDISYQDVHVFYDAYPGPISKRDYVAKFTVTEWSDYHAVNVKKAMRAAGASDIIGGIKHAVARDYVDFAFDIKQSKLKELTKR